MATIITNVQNATTKKFQRVVIFDLYVRFFPKLELKRWVRLISWSGRNPCLVTSLRSSLIGRSNWWPHSNILSLVDLIDDLSQIFSHLIDIIDDLTQIFSLWLIELMTSPKSSLSGWSHLTLIFSHCLADLIGWLHSDLLSLVDPFTNWNKTVLQMSIRTTLSCTCQWEWCCLLVSVKMILSRTCQWEWHMSRTCQWEWRCLARVNENDTAPHVSVRMTLSFTCQWEWHCFFTCQWEWHCPEGVNENDTVPHMSLRMTLSFTCQWEWHCFFTCQWEWHCPSRVNENDTVPHVSMRKTLSCTCPWEWYCPSRVNKNDTVLHRSMRMTLSRMCQWEWHCSHVSMRMTLSRTCQWEWHCPSLVNENYTVLRVSMRMTLNRALLSESFRCFMTHVFKVVVPVKSYIVIFVRSEWVLRSLAEVILFSSQNHFVYI